MKHDLWVEEYRPKVIDDYVWRDPEQKEQIRELIARGNLPHLMLSGSPGIGKTTLAKVMLNELGVNPGDILEINGSIDNGIDVIREKITNFVSIMGFGGIRYVLFDEADYLTPNAQASLRNLMEQYSRGARFILTCVYPDTRIYTDSGFYTINHIKESNFKEIKSLRNDITTKHIKISRSKNNLRIKTKHGFSISVTNNHKFIDDQGLEVFAKDLEIGNRLPIDLKSVYGKNININSENIFYYQRDEFINYMIENNIPSKEIKNWVRDNYDKILTKNQLSFMKDAFYDFDSKMTLNQFMTRYNLTKIKANNLINKLAANHLIEFNDQTGEFFFGKEQEFHNYLNNLQAMVNYKFGSYNVENIHDFGRVHNTITIDEIDKSISNYNFGSLDFDNALGRIIGFMYGDGHLSQGRIHLAGNNEECLNLVMKDLCFITNETIDYKIQSNGKKSFGLAVWIRNKALYWYLKFLGVPEGNKVFNNFSIKDDFYAYKIILKGIIQGYFDSDSKKIDINNKTVNGGILGQNKIETIENNQILEDIKNILKSYFGINSYIVKSKTPFISKYQSNTNKSNVKRNNFSLLLSTQESYFKFMDQIGFYYESKKRREDIYGYLLYKQQNTGYKFLSFTDWLTDFYNPDNKQINDIISEIELLQEEEYVYDCCFEEDHWYVTNGFVSHNCNYPHKIIAALKSRTQQYHFQELDREEFTLRAATILDQEEVDFDPETLMDFVDGSYPDLRKCINLLQQYSVKHKLLPLKEDDTGDPDWYEPVIEMFKTGKINEARKIIVQNIQQEEFEDFYRFLYDNLEFFGDTEDKQMEAILIIREGLINHTLCGDAEINLSATLVKLSMI